jgi:signal transduction histidine kinase
VVGWLGARLRTTRRRLAAAHRAAEAATRSREELLAAAAHDLKSPLAGIAMTAQLARRRLERREPATPVTSNLAGQLADVEASARRMAMIMDDMLDVARIQTGRPLRLSLESIHLLDVVEAAVAVYQPGTDRHTLRVIPNADPEGTWDRARVARVVDNLLSNAIKYSPSGGDIVLEVAQEDCGGGRRVAVLRVSDQGAGITAADMNQILERFFSGARAPRRIAGSGLRLASAGKLAEQHGGSLTAEPRQGGGSTLTLRLPL